MMFKFILNHQLNMMLALSAICGMMAVLLLITRFLPKRRKWILIFMELIAAFLLGFDRASYMYRGDVSHMGYVMVRLSNFMVFFLTSAVVFGFNLYLVDLLVSNDKVSKLPYRLKVSQLGAIFGMVIAVVSHFTGLYYYFDDQNVYHRGPGFLLCYIVPVVIPLIQFSVIQQYRHYFSRSIYISLILYIFVPIIVGIIQIFTYGLGMVNMAMVMVSVSLYIFAYVDINDEVERAHEIEIENFEKEHNRIKRIFEQIDTTFVAAIEKKDKYFAGHSFRVAELSRKIAMKAGKSDIECDQVYNTALLNSIGLLGIPDSVLEDTDNLEKNEYEIMKQITVYSQEILSNITEFPYLSKWTRSTCERYDGMGYPDGLKGEEIPEASRIVAVAAAFDSMSSKKRFRDSLAYTIVREEFIKQSGIIFDPHYADILIQIMDNENSFGKDNEGNTIENELSCKEYREIVSTGIAVNEKVTKIQFNFSEQKEKETDFSTSAIVLFYSYDRRTHANPKSIEAYKYTEYGELWFDGHFVSTSARNMEVNIRDSKDDDTVNTNHEIIAGRVEDHISIQLISAGKIVEAIVALPDISMPVYIGITGENCFISNICVDKTGDRLSAGDIKRIVGRVNYIDRLESDIPNLQIDSDRLVYTEGILLSDELTLVFHTMTMPASVLVWHCPYILIFYSDDKKPQGAGYKEYALVKLNGEVTGDENYAQNRFSMKKEESFSGWDDWKEKNKQGLECSVNVRKNGNKIILTTENLGIKIVNTTILKDSSTKVYVAITGYHVALTDIRIK